jgi:hypothetical protein
MILTENHIIHIRKNIPYIAKSIHEGFFDGMGDRLKLYGKEIGQNLRAKYHRNLRAGDLEKLKRTEDLERELVHNKIADLYGFKPSYVNYHLTNTFNPNDPSQAVAHATQQQLKGLVQSHAMTDPSFKSILTGLIKQKRTSQKDFDTSTEILDPSSRTAINPADQQALNILGYKSSVDPTKPPPINPIKYANYLRQERNTLRQQRRANIDRKITGVANYPSVTRPDMITRLGGKLLNRSQMLRNIYKNISTIV